MPSSNKKSQSTSPARRYCILDYSWGPIKIELRSDDDMNIQKKLNQLRKAMETACEDGNWNYDEHAWGVADGLRLACATLFDEEYIPLERPDVFIVEMDRPEPTEDEVTTTSAVEVGDISNGPRGVSGIAPSKSEDDGERL